MTDLLVKVENGIGGTTDITYKSSTKYENNFLPFPVQTVSSQAQSDGKGNVYRYEYDYYGGYYDPDEVEFRGFWKVWVCQPNCDTQTFESKTETWFYQNYYSKGKVLFQLLTSKDGHTREVVNTWTEQNVWNPDSRFPRLDQTTSTIRDRQGSNTYSYNHQTTYVYDDYLNVKEEHKYGMAPGETIRTYFTYTNFTTPRILSKPTDIKVTNGSGNIASRKWMDYDPNTGNLTQEEVCKSTTPDDQETGCIKRNSEHNPVSDQNPIINYEYDSNNNLSKIIDPMNNQTTMIYDDLTKTHVYETTNALGHKTTTVYDPATGNLLALTPPHLQGESSIIYTYDEFKRKKRETRPDGGLTEYTYPTLTDPNNQYGNTSSQHVRKQEHIIDLSGGGTVIDHYTYSFFDGLGRTYWSEGTGPQGKRIVTETTYDPSINRVWKKSNSYYYGENKYFTTFTYDGLSRVTNVAIPDTTYTIPPQTVYRNIGTTYYGLKKVVTNQRGYSTAYTYDVYQRLVKVEEPTTPTTTFTEYSHDVLGNLTEVRAAKDASGGNLLGASITTSMTYDSLSKKRTMSDPDMGFWQYDYDKSGNLTLQIDAKGQAITFQYDSLNRLRFKNYCTSYVIGRNPPCEIDHTVSYDYDEDSVLFSKGKLTKVSDPYPSGAETKEDRVVEYDIMQRVKQSQKTIPGRDPVVFVRGYDSAGRVLSILYPGDRTYRYEYDVAGNLLRLKDNATQTNVVEYSEFTHLGQPQFATFPKPNNISVKTSYLYYPETGRLHTLVTQKMNGITPVETYQNLDYQEYDEKGNIKKLYDSVNNITHTYTYDSLDRLKTADGGGVYPAQSYDYDQIGNIMSKSDVGTYVYGDYVNNNYASKPHAVRAAGSIRYDYDANGSMIQRFDGAVTTTVEWNYDNKPISISNGSTTVSFTYDGNGQRVKKDSSVSGITYYFGELYEVRSGVEILHLFAGNRRVSSIRVTDEKHQFYHPNHLGSASVITDQNGEKKEKIEYYPFGTYRPSDDPQNPRGTWDYDPDFPDVNYTFTDQEDDDDLGLYNYGARLYDPALGKFVSPDRIVQAPENPQSLNRYSYVLNNPLIYTDSSGEFIDVLFIALVATAMVFGGMQGYMNAQLGGGSVWKGAFIGAVEAGAATVISMGVTNFLFPGANQAHIWQAFTPGTRIAAAATGGFTAGAVSGGLNAAFNGGNVWQAALYGGLAGAAMAGAMQGAIELNHWYGSANGFGGPGTGGNRLTESSPTASYENPIEDGGLRITDSQGSGIYGASRGKSTHAGIDILGEVGDPVGSPFEGTARVDRYREAGGGVNVTGKNHYARLLHIKPGQDVINAGAKGLEVFRGQVIGTIADIRGIFPGIQNHVHFELYTLNPFKNINPTCYVLNCFY